MNGTVFHKQQFLSYHAPGKFNFHHLLFYHGKTLIAVLAGGIRGAGYESPLGASYGSFVTMDISADEALAIVEAFENYITARGVKDVFLTSAPVIYQPIITQNLDFALLYRGYAYQRHYISHAIDLARDLPILDRFHPSAKRHYKYAEKQPGLVVNEIDQVTLPGELREFYPIMVENKARLGTTPTHTLEDLLRLNDLLPDLIKLFTARLSGELIAGFLLFRANARVALSFYPMMRYDYEEYKPMYLLSHRAIDWAKQEGYAFFDLGVSQDTSDENPMTPKLSLIQFKEKFDSRGLLRSTLWKRYQ
jgi:hypothetical protein